MLKQMMPLFKKNHHVLNFTHRFDLYGAQPSGIRLGLRLQVKWAEAPNVADTLEKAIIHWVKISKILKISCVLLLEPCEVGVTCLFVLERT
jgi:hypothetical protein